MLVDAEGTASIRQPHQPGYQNNAAVVGGGTLVYGGQAWRFLPEDFRMASTYGVPAGSSLTDWPISYEDLAPWYERAEWEIGVSGDSANAARLWPRARDYPMPPVPPGPGGRVLARGAEALGIATLTPPLLINTEPRAGRGACIQCGSCVGFPCPSDGKNGTQNTMLPRALATGACDLVTRAMGRTDHHGQQRPGDRRVGPGRGCRRRPDAARAARAGGDPLPPAPSRPRGFCSRQAPPPNPKASATGTTRSDGTCRGIAPAGSSACSRTRSPTISARGSASPRRPGTTTIRVSSAAAWWRTTSSFCRSSTGSRRCRQDSAAGAPRRRTTCAGTIGG